MNSFNRKLCALLLFNLFLIFSFCCSSYGADSTPNMNNLSDYTYEQTFPESSYELINNMESRSEVINNSFYYFIIPSGLTDGTVRFTTFLFNKNYVKDFYFRFTTTNSNGMYKTDLIVYFKNNVDSIGTNGSVNYRFEAWRNKLTSGNIVNAIDGFDGCWYEKYSGSDSSFCGTSLVIYSYSYFNEGTYLMPYVTNYPYEIKGSSNPFYSSDNIVTVKRKTPHLLNSKSELQMSSYEFLGVLYPTFLTPVDVYLKIINQSTKETVLSIKCNDYRDYVSRSDVEDPFSSLSYNIPLSLVPKYELLENTQYNFQVSYNVGTATIYNNNYVLVAVPLNHTPTGSVGGGGEEGGNTTGGGSTVTPEDDKNQQLQNAIGESTDKIVESNKQTQEKIEEQTNAIKENTDTNKNIFEKIGDILSFLNPFSDNFFGKKLVELIINGLKSLFVPEEGFFDEYFNSIRDWFSDRLGFLFAPFDFIIELLNRISNINFSEPIINIPDIKAPFTDTNLINKQVYNLNDLNNNEVFNNIHNIYLAGVDFIILIGLINLARKKIEEVFVN